MKMCPIAKSLIFTFLFQLQVSKPQRKSKVHRVHLYFTQLHSFTTISSHTKYTLMILLTTTSEKPNSLLAGWFGVWGVFFTRKQGGRV